IGFIWVFHELIEQNDGLLMLPELLLAAGLVQSRVEAGHSRAIVLIDLLVAIGSAGVGRFLFRGTLGERLRCLFGSGSREKEGLKEVHTKPLLLLDFLRVLHFCRKGLQSL